MNKKSGICLFLSILIIIALMVGICEICKDRSDETINCIDRHIEEVMDR